MHCTTTETLTSPSDIMSCLLLYGSPSSHTHEQMHSLLKGQSSDSHDSELNDKRQTSSLLPDLQVTTNERQNKFSNWILFFTSRPKPCPNWPCNLQRRDAGTRLVAHHAAELLGEDVVLQPNTAWQHLGDLSLQVCSDLGHIAHGEEDLDAALQHLRSHPTVVSPHGLDAFCVKHWLFLVTGLVHEAHIPFLGLEHTGQVHLEKKLKTLCCLCCVLALHDHWKWNQMYTHKKIWFFDVQMSSSAWKLCNSDLKKQQQQKTVM